MFDDGQYAPGDRVWTVEPWPAAYNDSKGPLGALDPEGLARQDYRLVELVVCCAEGVDLGADGTPKRYRVQYLKREDVRWLRARWPGSEDVDWRTTWLTERTRIHLEPQAAARAAAQELEPLQAAVALVLERLHKLGQG